MPGMNPRIPTARRTPPTASAAVCSGVLPSRALRSVAASTAVSLSVFADDGILRKRKLSACKIAPSERAYRPEPCLRGKLLRYHDARLRPSSVGAEMLSAPL